MINEHEFSLTKEMVKKLQQVLPGSSPFTSYINENLIVVMVFYKTIYDRNPKKSESGYTIPKDALYSSIYKKIENNTFTYQDLIEAFDKIENSHSLFKGNLSRYIENPFDYRRVPSIPNRYKEQLIILKHVRNSSPIYA